MQEDGKLLIVILTRYTADAEYILRCISRATIKEEGKHLMGKGRLSTETADYLAISYYPFLVKTKGVAVTSVPSLRIAGECLRDRLGTKKVDQVVIFKNDAVSKMLIGGILESSCVPEHYKVLYAEDLM